MSAPIAFNDHLAHHTYGYLTRISNANVQIIEGLGDSVIDNQLYETEMVSNPQADLEVFPSLTEVEISPEIQYDMVVDPDVVEVVNG